MLRFSFKVGLVFIEGVIRWELRRRLPSGKLQFEAENSELLNLSDREVSTRWMTQTWVIDEASLGSAASAMYLAVPRDLSTFPDRHQEEAKRRLHYLTRVGPDANPYSAQRWRELIAAAAAELGDRKVPGPSTVADWWRRYRVTKSVLKLIPNLPQSNGPKGKHRYQVFEEVIATVFLTNQQLPKSAVVEAMERQIKAINGALPAEEQIRMPARSTVYRWIDDLQQDLVDAARHGAEAARVKYRTALGKVLVGGVLERVEIDHSPIDLIVIDKLTKLPLGRPWLTIALDVHSRMVLGFYISFNAPSGHGVLQCLRRAILPKDELLARFPDIKGEWPAHGLIDLLAVDNGADLHSEALEKACLEMGIQLLFCGSKTPWHKGAVERFFRTLNTGLIHRLPGTVFSSVDERGDYPAEEKAVIDMETLVHLVTKWIVDHYNVSFHRGIGARPIDRWLEGVRGKVIELPVYPQQMEVLTGIPAKRTLFHYGIELEGLHYNSDLLQLIRRRTGENLPVALKYYEDTVAHIHVFDPVAKEYIQVPARSAEYAHQLPRDIHRLVREHARKRFGEHCNADQLLEARAEIEAIVKQAIKDKRMGSRKMGAGLLQHDSEAVLGQRDPLQEARKPIKKADSPPPSDLPSGLDDDLPEIGSYDWREQP